MLNSLYKKLLKEILDNGVLMQGRNGGYWSHIGLPQLCFTKPPLITVIRPAFSLAALETWWVLQGEDVPVPSRLSHWWANQLNPENKYINGYGYQFRQSTYRKPDKSIGHFDQIEYIKRMLRESPGSRHSVISAWNTGEMATIVQANECSGSPACCHDTVTQFFVRNNALWLKTYQRSADMRLGFVHNIYQSWIILEYIAYVTGYSVGGVYYVLGDAHIYNEATHLKAVAAIVSYSDEVLDNMPEPTFSYCPTSENFNDTDFTVTNIPEPLVTQKSVLL